MQSNPAHWLTLGERICRAWSWICFGFFFGFTACVWLIDAGMSAERLRFFYWWFWGIPLLLAAVPESALQIIRALRRFRQASREGSTDNH